MNEDPILSKNQTTPAVPNSTTPPDDTEEQDTVSDRVFDFSDGDIKPVKDVDGPVTHDVNVEIAEALRKPLTTPIKTPLQKNPTQQTPPPVSTPIQPKASTPDSWRPISSQPINKLEVEPLSRPIPHPAIDPSMQAPPVKIYSQIPRKPDPIPSTPIPNNISTEVQKQTIKKVGSIQKITPAEKPVIDATLQEVLKRAYGRAQNRPPIPDGSLLDKKIGTFQASPFATAPATNSSQNSIYREPIDTPVSPVIASVSKAPSKAPVTIDTPRTTPSNPPAKTIGRNMSDFTDSATTFSPNIKRNLQDEISSVLPNEKNIATKDLPQSVQANQPKQPTLEPLPYNAPGQAKTMRTYEGDVAEIMSHRRTSTASIAIAESKKETGEERIANDASSRQNSNSILKVIMVIASLALIGGGAYTGYYFYIRSPLAPVTTTTTQNKQVNNIISADSISVIPIDGQIPVTIKSRIESEAAKEQDLGTIKEIVFTMRNKAGELMRVSSSEMIEIMDIAVPDMVLRSLTPDWMFGIYKDQNASQNAFIIVTTNFFQNTFSGMLQWEQVMPDDLKQYLPKKQVDLTGIPLSVSTTTSSASSTTSTVASYLTIKGAFQDRIIKNKDVRSFRSDTGQILFLYSFIDDTHLIIAANEITLTEVLTRLEKKAFIR